MLLKWLLQKHIFFFLKFLAKTSPLAFFGYIFQLTNALEEFSTLLSELINSCLCNVFQTELPTVTRDCLWKSNQIILGLTNL